MEVEHDGICGGAGIVVFVSGDRHEHNQPAGIAEPYPTLTSSDARGGKRTMSNETKFETVAMETLPGYIEHSSDGDGIGQFRIVAFNVHDHEIGKGERILVELKTKEEVDQIMKDLQSERDPAKQCRGDMFADPEAHE